MKQLKENKFKNEIIYALLEDGSLDFSKITEMYVRSLKERKSKDSYTMLGLASCLLLHQEKPLKKEKLFLKLKSIFYIIKSGFYNTPKDWKDLMEKHKCKENRGFFHYTP